MLTNTNTQKLEIAERPAERGGAKLVWAKDMAMDGYLTNPVCVLEPDELYSEYRYVLCLADDSAIFLSQEQAEAIAKSVANIQRG